MVRDVGLAEDLAQDALVAALERWPESGVPDNPGAWLMATAKHRAIDQLRRKSLLERKHAELGHELEARQETATAEPDAAIDDDIGDDPLRLVFPACHPVVPTKARGALGRADRHIGRAEPAAGPGPGALGSAPHSAWPRGSRARGGAWRSARAVRVAGRDRRLSRAGTHAGGDGLGAHRGALRCARRARAIAGGGAESGGRRRDGVWSGRGPRAGP